MALFADRLQFTIEEPINKGVPCFPGAWDNGINVIYRDIIVAFLAEFGRHERFAKGTLIDAVSDSGSFEAIGAFGGFPPE